MHYVFSDADILIKLVRSELRDYFEQLISALSRSIFIPAYILHTELKKCDSLIYNFLCDKIELNIIQEIDTPVEINNPINLLFSQFSRHVDSGEAYVFSLAESMNSIVLTDNLNDLKIIQREYAVSFKAFTFYQLCYLIYKHNLRTEAQINKHLSKLVQSHDIRSSDSVIRNGFGIVIKKLTKENFN